MLYLYLHVCLYLVSPVRGRYKFRSLLYWLQNSRLQTEAFGKYNNFKDFKHFCYGIISNATKNVLQNLTWYGFLATTSASPFSSNSPAFRFAFPSQFAAKWPIWPHRKHLSCCPAMKTTWNVVFPKAKIISWKQENHATNWRWCLVIGRRHEIHIVLQISIF